MNSTDADWQPQGIDVHTPSTARMYDYYLGGKDNFPADRAAADQVLEQLPDLAALARTNRAFLQEAVRYLIEQAGIRQIIDIGTGIPTQGQVHQVARDTAPGTRVVYVDNDPIVLAHARALLADGDDVAVVDADMREPQQLLAGIDRTGLINFREPVAVLFVAVFHFISDADNPAGIIEHVRARMAPGSHLVISHVTGERDPDTVGKAAETYNTATSAVTLRTTSEVRALFTGFDLIEPGVVPVDQWHVGGHATPDPRVLGVAGVAIKP